ncbi:MAG: hypothetical protein KGM49_12280 [Sphingomonadales bacterium]|nr:hypothetical protein [Sphingomonadales bacterium]
MRYNFPAIVLVLALGLGSPAALAETETIGSLHLDYDNPVLRPASPAQRRLVAAYRAAMAGRANGGQMLTALDHPASAACPDTLEQRYFGAYLKRADRIAPIPADAKVIFVPLRPGTDLPFAGGPMTRNPVEPSAVLAISYRKTEGGKPGQTLRLISRSLIEQIALSDGQWRIVRPCLTQAGAARARQRMDAEARAH